MLLQPYTQKLFLFHAIVSHVTVNKAGGGKDTGKTWRSVVLWKGVKKNDILRVK